MIQYSEPPKSFGQSTLNLFLTQKAKELQAYYEWIKERDRYNNLFIDLRYSKKQTDKNKLWAHRTYAEHLFYRWQFQTKLLNAALSKLNVKSI